LHLTKSVLKETVADNAQSLLNVVKDDKLLVMLHFKTFAF